MGVNHSISYTIVVVVVVVVVGGGEGGVAVVVKALPVRVPLTDSANWLL